MPHYKDGLKAEIGDVVIFPWEDGKTQPPEKVGTLLGIQEGATSCNGTAAFIESFEAPCSIPYELRSNWPATITASADTFRVPLVRTSCATIGEMTLLYRPGAGNASAVASKAINDVLDAKLKMAEAAADGLVGPDGEKVEVPRGILPADGLVHGEPVTYPEGFVPGKLEPADPDAPAEVGYSTGLVSSDDMPRVGRGDACPPGGHVHTDDQPIPF